MSGFILLGFLRPVLAAVVLWLLARPIGKWILRDFDDISS
jgi:hypothetical protein